MTAPQQTPDDILFTTQDRIHDTLCWPNRRLVRLAWIGAATHVSSALDAYAVGLAFTALSFELLADMFTWRALEHRASTDEEQTQQRDRLVSAVTALSEAVATWGVVVEVLDGVRKQQPQRAAGVTVPTGTHVEMLARTLVRLQDMLAGFGIRYAVPLFPSTGTTTSETLHRPPNEWSGQEVQP